MRGQRSFILVILFMLSTAAMAYVLLNPPRRWFPTDLPRMVYVDSQGMSGVDDGDHGFSAALGAVTEWNSGGPNIVSSSPGGQSVTLGDGRSNLVFRDPVGVCTGWCLAATFTGFYDGSQTGTCDGLDCVQVTDSDIVFNKKLPARMGWTSASEDSESTCSREIFLEPVVAHEVGHLIGLSHSGDPSALMWSSVGTCDNKPLDADDTAGRDALYDCQTWSEGGGCTPTDADSDGYNSPSCGGNDCNDSDPSINPGAIEVCDDGVDNDCDGLTDAADPDCPGGGCNLGQVGDPCTEDAACCSNKCRGKPGRKFCKAA
jgi:hypothetical protein